MNDLTIAQALKRSELLSEISDTAELDVQLLLLEVLDKPSSYLFTWPDRVLAAEQLQRFESLLTRRIAGEPIAFILGYQHFWTLKLAVAKDTLIPRPDTELLVEQALQLLSNKKCRVADLGTGTGAVALALASERSQWEIVACDYVACAAALAERNRQSLNISNVEVLEGSWFEPLSGKFDLIVSNPPYIDKQDVHLSEGDVRFEPLTALVADDNGLQDIKHIIETAPRYLVVGGWLLLEHGFEQAKSVSEWFVINNFSHVLTVKDLNNNDRVTYAQWQMPEL
ncbi:MAG: peptide chain release factor N(5)-glutamine methyltransferase [Oceanospirillaceae bacterium]